MKGVALDGGLRDYYLALQQITENRIEYLKVSVAAAAALGQIDIVNKQMKELQQLLGMVPRQGEAHGQWMDDPKKVAQSMELLQNWKPKIRIN